MIEEIKENKYDINNYIGDQYYKCLYLYLDYKKYGINSEKIRIFVQKDSKDNIIAIFLNYSTSLHIFSKELNCDFKEISYFIKEKKYKAVFAEKKLINRLEKYLDKNYDFEYGNVWKINEIKEMDTKDVERINDKQIEKVAELIMSDDDIASSYNYNDLVNQLRERNSQGFGRNYVIRENERIISHVSTNAEVDDVAIVALLIVDSEFRRKGIATKMLCKIEEDLRNEGKKAYLINYSNTSTSLYNKLGLTQCCEWGKIILK